VVAAAAAAGPPTGTPIKIGVLADMGGSPGFALGGAEMHLNSDLAAQAINAAGGINGHPLQILYADPNSNATQASDLALQFVQQDDVDALVGAQGSPECTAVEDLAQRLGIIYVASSGCAAEDPTSKTCNKFSFRTMPVGGQTLRPMTQALVQTYGKRWAVLYTDYLLGQSQLAAFTAAVQTAGGEVTTPIATPQQVTNYAPYVTRVPTDGSIDGLLNAEVDSAGSMAALQQFGITGKVPVVLSGNGIEFFGGVWPDSLDGSIHVGIHLSQPQPDNPFDQRYFDAFRAQAQRDPTMAQILGGVDHALSGNTLGYEAYTAITALKVAMTKSGYSGKSDMQKLIAAMEQLNEPMSDDFPAGQFVMSPTDHQGRSTVYVMRLHGQQDEIVQAIPAQQVPPIGDCHV
jgi:branched-chain amino acid transport system substrate-binding protein